MNEPRMIRICSDCYQHEPRVYSEDIGVGGTCYGDSYSFDRNVVHSTDCCNSPYVVVIEESELPELKKYFEENPKHGWKDIHIELIPVQPDEPDIDIY